MSDIISREDAREAIEDLMDIHFDRQVVLAKARDAIVSLPSEVCDDCIWHVCNYNKVDWDGEDGYISKRDALAEFKDGRDVYDIMESIKSLPSAEPKQGEWKLDPNGMDWNIPAWRCSECGFVANYIGVEANGLGNNPMNWAGSNFCPHCGAKMEGGEKE